MDIVHYTVKDMRNGKGCYVSHNVSILLVGTQKMKRTNIVRYVSIRRPKISDCPIKHNISNMLAIHYQYHRHHLEHGCDLRIYYILIEISLKLVPWMKHIYAPLDSCTFCFYRLIS